MAWRFETFSRALDLNTTATEVSSLFKLGNRFWLHFWLLGGPRLFSRQTYIQRGRNVCATTSHGFGIQGLFFLQLFFLEILLIPSFVTGPLFSHGACFARSGRNGTVRGVGRRCCLLTKSARRHHSGFWLEIETLKESERARDFFSLVHLTFSPRHHLSLSFPFLS
jgi:hypothetical protein